MRPIEIVTARDRAEAQALLSGRPDLADEARPHYLAGGTVLLDLMKLEALSPALLVDINPLQDELGAVSVEPEGLRLGALARMADVAAHPQVAALYPAIAQSLSEAASPQLRNMASLAGNVLQKTRCPYYRDVGWTACNKRAPGSGCAALAGHDRRQAILGVSDKCIALYPGDFANALVAFGAEVEIVGRDGARRRIPFEDVHREPGDDPSRETHLAFGDLLTHFHVPSGPWTRRSVYVKVRDRASYDFALASAAAALDLDSTGVVREARIGLGGVATRPWRAREAEALLAGERLDEASARRAAEAAFAAAKPHGRNAYKAELGRRTLVRALLEAARLETPA